MAQHHNIHQLLFCDDVINTILSFCHANKIFAFLPVSKQFYQIIKPRITAAEFCKHENALLFVKSKTDFVITKLKISLVSDAKKILKLLLKSKKSRNLTVLDLKNNQFGDSEVKDIANCSNLQNLKYLDLGCNQMGVSGLISIIKSKKMVNLTHLSVSRNQFLEEFDFSILESYLPQLKSLDISANRFSDINPLLHSIKRLNSLNLRELYSVNWRILNYTPEFNSLTCLKIGRNTGLENFIKKFLLMENDESLIELDVGHSDLSLENAMKILEKFRNLRRFNLSGVQSVNIQRQLEKFLGVNDKIEAFSYFC